MSATDIVRNENFFIDMGPDEDCMDKRLCVLLKIDPELPEYTHLLYPRLGDDYKLRLQVFNRNAGKFTAIHFFAEVKGWVLK